MPAVDPEMLRALRQMPNIFSVAPDPRILKEKLTFACRIGADLCTLRIVCLDSANDFYDALFDEDVLDYKRPVGISWKEFFEQIQESFNKRDLKVEHDGEDKLIALIKDFGQELAFELLKSDDPSAPQLMVNWLMHSYQIRHDSTGSKAIEELCRQEGQIKLKASSAELQKSSLESLKSRSENDIKNYGDQMASLTPELDKVYNKFTEVCRAVGKDPEEVEASTPIEPDMQANTRFGVQPLDTTCRPYDELIMKMIKSLLGSDGDEPDSEDEEEGTTPGFQQIIRPMTKHEYHLQMKNLPRGQQQAVMRVIEKLDQWDYDVWTLSDTEFAAMFYTSYALFLRWDMFKRFNIDEQVALNLFSQVEAGYHPNPYHNAMHGADVNHILHYILGPGGLKEKAKLTDADVLAALVAGMIHDYDHPGLNNSFHVKVQSYLATLYNDRSILENHHLSQVFDLMKDPKFNIFANLNEETRRDVRETMIEMVLSTDMGLHTKIFGHFKRRVGDNHNLGDKKEDQRLALSLAIKMADISNCGRPEHLYLKWASKLVEEFFLQGDNEKRRGDPISPFMDRTTPAMAKSQIAFMNWIVIPMFEAIAEYLPDMHFTVEQCESNKSYWVSNDVGLT